MLKRIDFRVLLVVKLYSYFEQTIYPVPVVSYALCLQVTSMNVPWKEFLIHWPIWAIYIAHFSMNWSNYIIMQWLPTYLSDVLSANEESLSLTAMPYVVNSLVGIGNAEFGAVMG